MTALEDRVRTAFQAVARTVEPNPDLFARVTRSIEADRERRRWRWRVGLLVGAFLGGLSAIGAAFSDINNGRIIMPWWVLEVLTNVLLVAIAVVLGPFIKRFGRSYAADVFRANPRTGKSYLVLTDVAYYLIFGAYILFTIAYEPHADWADDVVAKQVQNETARLGGILLLLGLLHAANIVMLPVIGRMLSLNRKLDEQELGGSDPRTQPPLPPSGGSTGAGSWVLRFEPAMAPHEPPDPAPRDTA